MSQKAVRETIVSRKKYAEKARKDIIGHEMLRTEECGHIEVESDEKTYDITQDQLLNHVSIKACEQAFELKLEEAPIYAKYSLNGTYMLLRNDKGYLASFNSRSMDMHFEIDLNEDVHDALYLHNERFIAVAQKNNVFIYDGHGVEVHCIRDNSGVYKMDYLPYHYLLATVSRRNLLRYQDVSTGKMVSEIRMKDWDIASMKHNISNGIIHMGNAKGVVSLWSPNSKEYLMKMLCHKSTVSSIEIDRTGKYMISSGLDGKVNVWDLRNTYTQLNSLNSRSHGIVTSLSQKNMLAMSYGNKVYVWKDFIESKGSDVLYMKHKMSKDVYSLGFCNYEDILSIGHSTGVSSIIIPGSGDPVYDSYEDSPFISKKAKSEKEVRMLIDKIPYELISIESNVGRIYKTQNAEMPNNASKRYFDGLQSKSVKKNALSRFYKDKASA
ncbi:BING4 family of nucleolar WD40 repeat protein [Ordospora pajunii]|uniref:BING4 family of nucleolar WD40 repeat protein n=1 Tax=Ordospora pajunii TaxID=3039483 RepID=UPI00295267D0|nr:BING4 family of nucleolar WD40 repeat protein [Ordospora pajunii]KAH9411333.1 BING4 family of nucleolar WD40 repeat protein [Ordospora pajunii]